jgi:membrane fusion protein
MPERLVPPPFLDDEPPPWLARGLATSALTIAAVAFLAGIVVTVPETVSGRFMLVPTHGADPVRAPKEGIVDRVAATDAMPVRRGDTLFVVASEPALDRGADRQGLEATVASGPISRRDLAAQWEAVRSADASERVRLDERVVTLERSIAAKREQLGIARDLVDRARRGTATGVTSEFDLASYRLGVSRIEDELATAEGALADTRAARTRLDFDAAAREVDHRERIRRLDIAIEQARARLAALRATGGAGGTGLVVPSPCGGTLLRLRVRAAGTFVAQGELLADVACASDSLIVVVDVPASGVGRVRPGQAVRLLYDAFPYQRYGVRYAEVTWVGAATAAATLGDSTGFRARARADDHAIHVDGADRPLVPGMGGVARIVVQRHRLISYAFAPLMQLREAMSDRKRPRTSPRRKRGPGRFSSTSTA